MEIGKVGLIGAMNEEIELILEKLEHKVATQKAGITFYEGFFSDKPAVLCKSGVGKVNAAVCTQLLIDVFGVEAVIFTGVAGALDPDLFIGDIVISTDCMHHDMDVTVLGFERGIIPYDDHSVFPADPVLSDLAYEESRRLFPGHTMRGRVLSGDQFIADRSLVKQLHEQMGGACTEMEGAAVAQVCFMNKTPFVIIRSISDKADGSAHVDFVEFTAKASRHSFQIVEAMVARLH